MRTSRPHGLAARILVLVCLIAGASFAHALQIRQETSRFDGIAIPDPSVVVSPAGVNAEAAGNPESLKGAWASFKDAHGKAWDITIDARSGAPLLVQGEGIPMIPGSGNTLQSAAPVTLDSLASMLRSFLSSSSSLTLSADMELVLDRDGSGQVTDDLWKVVFDREVVGVPVAGDRYVFYVGHGNLIAFGASRWSAITTSELAYVPLETARSILFRYMGLTETDKPQLVEDGSLLFLPMAAAGSEVDSYLGSVGAGYETALAWRFAVEVPGEPGKWTGLVDAHSGRVLALYDTIQYAQAKGGVLPLTDDGICPDGCEQAGFPMPYTDIHIGATTSTAGSMGAFTCSPGGSSASTTLNAQYVKVVDSCGAISVSVTCDADLDLKTSSGTDCIVPPGTSAGDTHAARSSFYHLNRIKEHARAWLPSNSWLAAKLTDNVNLNMTCNAFWNDGGATGTVNFYRSGGGCRNTGEIAAVFLHEWGHGLDQNDGGGYDNPSEAYADVTSFLLTHKSCIGRGFVSSNCGGYGNACLSCTGVRDQDWNQHSTHAPQTPANWPGSCPSGSGPCGKEVHCESYLSGQTVWDLAVRDLPASGLDAQTAWQIVDRLWFKSRTGSGGNAYACGATVANRSCAATSWMQEFRVVDDDDGNLANGTPHAAAIFAAFNRHLIPCGAVGDATNQNQTSCPSLPAPTLSTTPGSNQIGLSWTAVAGAASYNVLRNDQGCGWGFTILANVAGTTYTDTNLPNGFPLYYSIQPVGSNAACVGTLSTCTTAQGSAATADLGVAKSGPGTAATGTNISYTVTVTNSGPNTATSAQLLDAVPAHTTFQSITAAPGWSCSTPSVGGTGTISCTAPSFAIGSPATFTIVLRASECSGNGTVVTNTATVSSATSDPSSANNSSSAATTLTDSGACSDGNACTQSDACQSGVCVGSNPVVCTPSDACHVAGTCNAATGLCSNPAKPNGTACDDSDRCTQTDTCQAGVCTGSSPVLCSALDACHDAGTCNPSSGVCSNPPKPDGTVCSDGDACTETDVCQSGTCTGSSPIVCTASDACHDAGTCNPATGLCTNPSKPDGTACNDGDACSQTDTCQSGACTGSDPVVCVASDPCHLAGACIPATGLCSSQTQAPDGTACDDGSACTSDACASGQCIGTAIDCNDHNNCTIDSCDPLSGCVNQPVNISDGNECTIDICDPETGSAVFVPRVCEDSNPCTTDSCDTVIGCVFTANTDACDDGDPCTAGDACSNSQCVGGPPAQPPAEVTNQQFSTKTLQQWDTLTVAGPPASYDVARGLIGEWPVGGGASEQCLAAATADTSFDSSEDPASESGFWYLVRGRSACGIGSYGNASDGSPRASTVCP